MPLPLWIPAYSVGNKTLDEQHKVILDLCARIQNLSKSDPEYQEKLHIALHDMSVYAAKHFEEEERILSEIGYHDLENHRTGHDKYHELLTELLLDAVNGIPDAGKMADFLENWWVGHILNSDMKYKQTLTRDLHA